MFFLKELTARDQIKVLHQLKHEVEHGTIHGRGLRPFIADALKDMGYFGSSVGSPRETALSREILGVLTLPRDDPANLDAWALTADKEAVIDLIDETIKYLQ